MLSRSPDTGNKGLASVSPFLLDASRLVARGVNVLPLQPEDKRPAVRSWKVLQETHLIDRDWDEVDAWLCEKWDGTRNNLAAVTGAISGILVVDVDDDAARAVVEDACGSWPVTVTTKTAKGWHLWFRADEEHGNRVRVGAVGLDVRGDGGYVVCPPSIHPSGFEYTWERSPWEFDGGMWPPAEMPEGIRDLLWPKPRPKPPSRFPRAGEGGHGDRYVSTAVEREAEAVASAPEGARNDTLNKAAYSLGRFVASGELGSQEAEQALLAAASAAGLPPNEALKTVQSGLSSR